MNKKEMIMNDIGLDNDEKRVADILVPGQKIEHLADVSWEMLEKNFQYLSLNLSGDLLLTGRESVGCFSWEEKFDCGYGSKKEYAQLRKQKASYHDKFKFIKLKNIDSIYVIIAAVARITDNKNFDIPLIDLKASDENSTEYVLLEDYLMWFVSYNGAWG